jgi:hypothetical protein
MVRIVSCCGEAERPASVIEEVVADLHFQALDPLAGTEANSHFVKSPAAFNH